MFLCGLKVLKIFVETSAVSQPGALIRPDVQLLVPHAVHYWHLLEEPYNCRDLKWLVWTTSGLVNKSPSSACLRLIINLNRFNYKHKLTFLNVLIEFKKLWWWEQIEAWKLFRFVRFPIEFYRHIYRHPTINIWFQQF